MAKRTVFFVCGVGEPLMGGHPAYRFHRDFSTRDAALGYRNEMRRQGYRTRLVTIEVDGGTYYQDDKKE